MSQDRYLALYDAINWDAPNGDLRCTRCSEIGKPQRGSYPSALAHFEEILGPFPFPRTKARLLVVFQDPPAKDPKFKIASPHQSGADLAGDEHRYFCLSSLAWDVLKLAKQTNSESPCWPTDGTAAHFLHRYRTSAGVWSYDGFLTYFLFLFRPEDALITNLAKCHFGPSDKKVDPRKYRNCADKHLRAEVAELNPNLVLSFTSKLNFRFLTTYAPNLTKIPRLRLYHPGYISKPGAKRDQFLKELKTLGNELSKLGIDVDATRERWKSDFGIA